MPGWPTSARPAASWASRRSSPSSRAWVRRSPGTSGRVFYDPARTGPEFIFEEASSIMNMSMAATRTIITATGHYVPPRIVTNKDLEKLMDTSDEWIRERSGILERHHVDPGVGTSDLATEAARRAIADAGIEPSSIDFLIAATLSPDHYFPGIGVMVQAKL